MAELAAGASNQPAAALVLGQNDFSSSSLPTNPTRSAKNYLSQPAGLAFDPGGRLFIADSANRVVVYTPPFAIGQSIARIMGVVTAANSPPVSASTLASAPVGVFCREQSLCRGHRRRAHLGVRSVRAMGGGERGFLATGDGRDRPDWFSIGAVESGPGATQRIDPRRPGGCGLRRHGAIGCRLGEQSRAVVSAIDWIVHRRNARARTARFEYNSLNLIDGREVGFSGNTGSCSVNGALPFFLGRQRGD